MRGMGITHRYPREMFLNGADDRHSLSIINRSTYNFPIIGPDRKLTEIVSSLLLFVNISLLFIPTFTRD